MNAEKKQWATPVVFSINGGANIQTGGASFAGPEGSGPCVIVTTTTSVPFTSPAPTCGGQTMGSVTGITMGTVTLLTFSQPSMLYQSGSNFPGTGPFTDCMPDAGGSFLIGVQVANSATVMVNCS